MAQTVSILVFCSLEAQEGAAGKKVPEPRHLEIPAVAKDSLTNVAKAAMPKIDLPEYFITGKAVIDLPEVEKQPAVEDSDSKDVVSLLNPTLSRTRETVEPAFGTKEQIEGTSVQSFNGKAFASLGTFFSPRAGVWFGQMVGDYRYAVDGQYYRTEGFAPFTNCSGGSVNLQGNTTLKSYNPYLDQAAIQSKLTYKTDTYNWYGSPDPSISRNREDFKLTAGLKNWNPSPIPYSADLGFENFSVSDSSKTVDETRVDIAGSSSLMMASIPLNVTLRTFIGSVSYGNSSSGLFYLEATVASKLYVVGKLSLAGSLQGFIADGMDGQNILRLYPHLDAAYQLDDRHTVRATYAPEVKPVDLASQVFANRYISAFSNIKHTDDQQDATVAIESGWSDDVRTNIGVRVQSIMDYPLYADSLSQGVWLLAYGGRTTITTFSSEVFAKLPANDYFAATLTASLSNNSLTGNAVPYLPVFEVGARYGRQLAARWTGTVSLSLIHQRKDNVVNINTLPSILLIGLRCEYQLLRQAGVFVDVQNLLNQQYEYWKGYQEDPFVVSAGVSVRW